MKYAALSVACLALAACSSVDSRIRELKEEDQELTTKIDRLDARRRAVERLITALRMTQRSGDVSERVALARAEAHYQTTPAE